MNESEKGQNIHETYEGDVKYPYADVGATKLMHISSVSQENRRSYKYICPCCKKELQPRLGDKRVHYFAHMAGERCDQDRYIHTTAERLLKEKWDRDEPFEIMMKVRKKCKKSDICRFYEDCKCLKEEWETFDLKKWFSCCDVEKKCGDFIPDLCLTDKRGKRAPIFIEIWHTHKNSEEKVGSNNRIIEIRVKTMEDLEKLPKHPITESESTTFSNFDSTTLPPADFDGVRLMKYTLYDGSLKSFVDDEVDCRQLPVTHHPKALLEIVCRREDFRDGQEFRNYCAAIAINEGCNVQIRFHCRQYGRDWLTDGGTVGCQRDAANQGPIVCVPEEVKNCPYFVLDDSLLRRHVNDPRTIWKKDVLRR